jgi:penicillin-binding protein 2
MRKNILLFSLIAVFFLLVGRLFWLSVVQAQHYQDISQENRVRLIYEDVPRGIITDRSGKVLVRNTPEGREYLYAKELAHVIGYVGQADENDLKENEYLMLGDSVGKSGLEKEYDWLLSGQKAERLVEVDTGGEIIRELGYKEGQSGQDLRLYLDWEMQKSAYDALGDEVGAAIVSKPTGELLALVAKPSFDANIFTMTDIKNKQEQVAFLFADESQPVFNRAITGLYPPGSTFKPITALAGLESGKISADTVYEDVGNLCFGEWCFGNWYYLQYGRKEGEVNLVKALQRSNDIYFYQVSRLLGINLLSDWAKNFGLTMLTGIDLPGEAEGFFPNAEWKEEVKGESWYLGDTLITSIGQGDILTTPIQIHTMTASLSNRGTMCSPQLLDSYQEVYEREKWVTAEKKECRNLGLDPNNLDLVLTGMKQACEPGGTGWPLFNFGIGGESTASAGFKPIPVACKTGTAEFGDPQDKTHAWFVVFAPVDNPEVVVTILAEKAGEGSSDAAPIAKEILTHYFNNY